MDTHCKAECITELAAPSLLRRDETLGATILDRNIENSSGSSEFANFLNPRITNEALKLRIESRKYRNMDEWRSKQAAKRALYFFTYFVTYIGNFVTNF